MIKPSCVGSNPIERCVDPPLLASDTGKVAVTNPCLAAIKFVIVVEEFASLPKAVASSLSVASVAGAELSELARAVDNFA